MNLRQYLPFVGDDRPPRPEEATPEDVWQFNKRYVTHNERAPNRPLRPDRESVASAFDPVRKSADVDGRRYKAEYPWLYDPVRGVRWDFDPVQMRTLAQENAWVWMLVQSITKEIAGTPWTVVGDTDATETAKRLPTLPGERAPVEKDLPDRTAEAIHDLLRDPNPEDNWQDFIEQVMADPLEVGSLTATKVFPSSAYDDDDQLAVQPGAVRPTDIMPSAPEVWTKDYRGKTGLVEGFWQFQVRSAPGGTRPDSRGQQQPVFYDRTEVMWDDMSPRTNRRYGVPPTYTIRDFLKALDLSVVQEQEYLSRGSTPSGMVTFPDGIDRPAGEERSQIMTEDVKGKPWKLLEIEGTTAEYVPFSYNFQEMQFTERQQWYARVIASAFQVPTAVVGIEPEKVNYATFQGERENFESNTLGPYLQQLERVINDQLIEPHWGPSYRFEFQPGMSESTRGMISERVRSEFDANLSTRNEARRELGRDPVDDDADGFKDEVVEGSDDGEDDLGGLLASAGRNTEYSREADGDSGNVHKEGDEDGDRPLRNTEDWQAFAVQPSDVEALTDEIADDVQALFDAVLADDAVMADIEQLAADIDEDDEQSGEGDTDPDTEKSLSSLTRKLRDLLASSEVADRIREALDSQTEAAAREAVEQAVRQTGEDVDVDVAAIEAQLADREVAFADEFAERMADDIRDTVADGWAEGKNSREIAADIADQGDIAEGWGGAERIARQELQVATGEARSAFAAEAGKVEVWETSGDDRVREAHENMDGKWSRPSENWRVEYENGVVVEESVPGNSEYGIGCRCLTRLVDPEDVDEDDHAGI